MTRPLLLLLLSGCAPALIMRAPDTTVERAGLVVMEAHVELFEMNVTNSLVAREDWTRTAQTNVDRAVRRFAEHKGLRLLDPHSFEEHEYTRFYRWAYRALGQISDRAERRAFRNIRSVTQWSYDRPLLHWRKALAAEQVLVIWFRDTHMSPGVAALSVLGGGGSVATNARQLGVACLVQLATGEIVWCQRRTDSLGELRTSAEADKAVFDLLGRFSY